MTDLVPLVRDYFSKSDLGPWVKMEGEREGRGGEGEGEGEGDGGGGGGRGGGRGGLWRSPPLPACCSCV